MLSVGNIGQNNYNASFGCKKLKAVKAAKIAMDSANNDRLIKMAEESGRMTKKGVGALKTTSFLSQIFEFFTKKSAKNTQKPLRKATDPITEAVIKFQNGEITREEARKVLYKEGVARSCNDSMRKGVSQLLGEEEGYRLIN